MLIKINGNEIAAYPSEFQPKVMDLDNAISTKRTADGTLHRDRIAVKRAIEMTFPVIKEDIMRKLLKSMKNTFFDVYYPDPMDGYVTKKMYVGDRTTPMAIEKDGVIWWQGLKITLTEQ